MSSPKIRLAIVDDHRSFREALREALIKNYDFYEAIIEMANGVELIDFLKQHQLDVILLDIKMQPISGLEVLSIITKEYPEPRVIILSAFLNDVYMLECLKFGINALLSKNEHISDINDAILKAYNNEVYFTNLLANSFLKSYIRHYNKVSSEILPDFSLEEINIIELMTKGKQIDEIASIFYLSRRSVEIKVTKMKEKANIKTTIELVLYFLKRNLVQI